MVLSVVSAALKNNDNQVLIQQRPLNKNMGGFWEFPGGKIELFETPEMALSRELYEELGINVNINDMKPLGFSTCSIGNNYVFKPKQPTKPISDSSVVLVLLFEVHKWNGNIYSKENQPFTWVDNNTIYDYDLVSADIPFIKSVWPAKNKLTTNQVSKISNLSWCI